VRADLIPRVGDRSAAICCAPDRGALHAAGALRPRV